MPRVKRGVTAHAKHKKIIRQAKGFRGRRGNVFNICRGATNMAESCLLEASNGERPSWGARHVFDITR